MPTKNQTFSANFQPKSTDKECAKSVWLNLDRLLRDFLAILALHLTGEKPVFGKRAIAAWIKAETESTTYLSVDLGWTVCATIVRRAMLLPACQSK